jgi:transcriptional regulator of acetoin/glycerol metabolism
VTAADPLQPLATWRARRDGLTAERAAAIATAWLAGETNVAKLAREAGVSRDTVYADLRSQGIEPTVRSGVVPTESTEEGNGTA